MCFSDDSLPGQVVFVRAPKNTSDATCRICDRIRMPTGGSRVLTRADMQPLRCGPAARAWRCTARWCGRAGPMVWTLVSLLRARCSVRGAGYSTRVVARSIAARSLLTGAAARLTGAGVASRPCGRRCPTVWPGVSRVGSPVPRPWAARHARAYGRSMPGHCWPRVGHAGLGVGSMRRWGRSTTAGARSSRPRIRSSITWQRSTRSRSARS